MGLTKFPFYELGQQERGQGCIRNKCGMLYCSREYRAARASSRLELFISSFKSSARLEGKFETQEVQKIFYLVVRDRGIVVI